MNQPRPEPPSSAIWLLHHLLPAERREALLGDLLEQHHQGRSSRWFWREVLVALVLSLGTTLRTRRIEIAFAIVGTALQGIWWTTRWWKVIWQSQTMQSLSGWGLGWRFPLSSGYDILFHWLLQMLVLLLLVLVFFFWRGEAKGANMLRAIGIGLAFLAPGQLPLLLLRGSSSIYILASVPFFLALLLSIATSREPRLSVQPPSAPV